MFFFRFEMFLVSIGAAIAAVIALVSARRLRNDLHALHERNSTLQRNLDDLKSSYRDGLSAVNRSLTQMEERTRRIEVLLEREGVELPDLEAEIVFEEDVEQGPAPSQAPESAGAHPEPDRVARGLPPRKTATPPPLPPLRPKEQDEEWWLWFEESVGKRWMTWAGALALFLSVGFFIKYAFENQWLGPTGRVVLGIVAGLVMATAGDICTRREMRILGQGLLGGALAMLYVSLFSAFSLYALIPQAVAFSAMVLITAAGMTMAILHDARPLGFLAVLGGFLTPLMVSTGRDPRDALFLYLTVLDLGVLGVACFKRWRALDTLAFIGTWALFAGWFIRFYTSQAILPASLWLGVFFLLFLVIPFAYQLRQEAPSRVESFVLGLANAVAAFANAYVILESEYRFVLGFVALGVAACYITLGALLRRRVPEDSRSLLGFVGLAVIFLTLAVPLQLRQHGITLAWAVEGPILLYLGYVFRYRPVRIAGFVVVLLAVGRLFIAHWPLHRYEFVLFFNREFAAALFVPLAAAAYAVIHERQKSDATEWDEYLKLTAGILGGYLAIIIIDNETVRWFHLQTTPKAHMAHRYMSVCISAFIWALGATAFGGGAVWRGSRVFGYAGLPALVIAVFVTLSAYSTGLGTPYLLFLNVRFVVGILVALACVGYALVASGLGDLYSEEQQPLGSILWAVAGIFPLLLLSAETYTWCRANITSSSQAHWMAQMALSITWGLYAISALAVGFRLRLREVRMAALGLFALTIVKVLLVDMEQVGQLYRIVSFVVVGLTMIAASYLYHRLEKLLTEPSGDRT